MGDLFRRVLVGSSVNRCMRAVLCRRTILSTSFGQQDVMQKFLARRKAEVRDEGLSAICLKIDRCQQRNMPFSSFTIDSMVHAIEDGDDLVASIYYLFKFRHSNLCYFLRPWTAHSWFEKCLALGDTESALKVLADKSQYGLFPDDIIYLRFIDKCVKEGEYQLAFKFVSHAFLSEALGTKLSQLSCLFVILRMMETENSLSPTAVLSLEERRNFFAVCFRLGELLNIKSLTILGLAELGSIEKEHGIRAIYQEPWSPLLWTEGYLQKAILEMEGSDIALNKDVIDHIGLLIGEDENLVDLFDRNVSLVRSGGKISDEALTETLQRIFDSQISDAEKACISEFNTTVESWVKEHDHLAKVEREIMSEKLDERQKFFEERRLKRISKKMAVERLGYWEFQDLQDTETEEVEYHLREDYVDGASSDIEIETRAVGSV